MEHTRCRALIGTERYSTGRDAGFSELDVELWRSKCTFIILHRNTQFYPRNIWNPSEITQMSSLTIHFRTSKFANSLFTFAKYSHPRNIGDFAIPGGPSRLRNTRQLCDVRHLRNIRGPHLAISDLRKIGNLRKIRNFAISRSSQNRKSRKIENLRKIKNLRNILPNTLFIPGKN